MKQREFLSILQNDKRMQRELQDAILKGGDGLFYFTLGGIFGDLNINGWSSDTFICKVCKICDIEL